MSATKTSREKRSVGGAGRIHVRGEGSGHMKSSAAIELAEIKVGKHSWKTLRDRKGGLRKVVITYAGAVEKAERLGRAFEVLIRIDPDRAEPAVEQRDAPGDSLDQALIAARERGATRVAEIMKSPDMLSAREFAPLIGASHETVNQKRKTGEILALDGAKRGLRYPRWQTTEDGRLLPGLADLARELKGGPWTIYRFLLQAHPELNGETGLEALKKGRVTQTVDVARGIAEGTFA